MAGEANRFRISVLGVVLVSLFAVLYGRLWYLQILTSPDYSRVAQVNKLRVVPIAPIRGRILDRAGVALATNRSSTVITIDRKEIRKKARRDELFNRIANVLESDPVRVNARARNFESRYNDQRFQELDALPLAEDITDRQAIYLRERVEDYPGLDVRESQVRTYPYGSLAAHIVGYVGRITAETKSRYLSKDPPYQLSDIVGVTGIERIFEDDLRGVPGEVVYEVDASNRVIRKVSETLAVAGRDVVLSIDSTVQQLAEAALRAELELRRRASPSLSPEFAALGLESSATYKAPGGAVVIQDPTDGSVVALASYPTFDLRELAGGISKQRADLLTCTKKLEDAGGCDRELAPLVNRTIQGQYAPGSTFKLVTSVAALSTRLVASDHVEDDKGSFELPDCVEGQKCKWQNAGGAKYGKVDLPHALTVSSDVYYYWRGYDFWNFRGTFGYAIQDTAERMGMGRVTGIQLPSEAAGFVPTPERKKARHDGNPKAFPEGGYYVGDNINLAVGQGDMLVTPLQLANAYSAFGNGGFVLSPNIALRVTEPRNVDERLGKPVRVFERRELRDKLSLPTSVRDPILIGLLGVTSARNGTAFKTFEGSPLLATGVAGKTGTAQTGAQRLDQDDTSVFAAFAPALGPKYTVAAILEKSGFGSQAAAPVVRLLLESLLGVGACKPAPIVPLPEFDPAAPAQEPPPLPTECQNALVSFASGLQD